LGKPQILKKTTMENAVAIFAVGSMVPQAIEAAENLEKSGVGAYVIDPVILNFWDAEELNPWIEKVRGRVVVVEDHQQIGGYAQFLASQVAQAGLPLKLKVRAVQGEFGRSAYNAIDLYKINRLDAQAIQDSVLEFFKS
jgi:transketolase